MITSVYLSNNTVRVLIGKGSAKKVTIKKIYRMELSEGCLINGIITNADELERQLHLFWEENQLPKKNVSLLIGSSQFTVKNLRLPKMKPKKLMELLPHEMAEGERKEAPVYDYLTLAYHEAEIVPETPGTAVAVKPQAGKKKKKKAPKAKKSIQMSVMGVMVERHMLEDYINLFKRLGISVSAIHPVRTNIIKLLSMMKEMQDHSTIIQVLDGNNMTSLLFSDGECQYSSRVRLFNEKTSPQFPGEVARNVSNILQFRSTQRDAKAVEEICIGGLYDAQAREDCIAAIEQFGLKEYNFEVGKKITLPLRDNGTEREVRDYLPELGDFVLRKNDINLFERLKKNPDAMKKRRELIRGAIPAAAAAVIFAVICGGLFFSNHQKQNQLSEIQDFLLNPTNVEQAQEADLTVMATQALKQKTSQAQSVKEAVNSYPKVSSKVTDAIIGCEQGTVKVEVKSYLAETGTLQLLATAADVEEINHFIDRLEATGLFSNVQYTGYAYMESAQVYNINVVCYLAENAGK